MSGLLALLDDVAGIAKVAASSVDDVVSQAVKAGSKAAGAVIDDAAVTPKYVQGFSADRELPIIWKIAKGSFFNKLVVLLPIGMLLSTFAPWMIPPLLMLGGGYLCFEGAEKVAHALGWGGHGHEDYPHRDEHIEDPAALEEEKAAGAIKTDFILSAEIMTIALAAIPASTIVLTSGILVSTFGAELATEIARFFMEGAVLFTVAVMITVAVYGSVALIVKADDVGLALARNGRLGVTRGLGRGIVKVMPGFMKLLTIVGTAAMLWVGGSIIIHSLKEMGVAGPEHIVHDIAYAAGHAVPEQILGLTEWVTKAALDGVLGLLLGFILIPVGEKVITPIWRAVTAR